MGSQCRSRNRLTASSSAAGAPAQRDRHQLRERPHAVRASPSPRSGLRGRRLLRRAVGVVSAARPTARGVSGQSTPRAARSSLGHAATVTAAAQRGQQEEHLPSPGAAGAMAGRLCTACTTTRAVRALAPVPVQRVHRDLESSGERDSWHAGRARTLGRCVRRRAVAGVEGLRGPGQRPGSLQKLGGAEDAEEQWFLQSDGAAWTKDWLSRQLINLAAADAANSCCGRGNYFLDTRDKKTEWGASGALFEAFLTLSEKPHGRGDLGCSRGPWSRSWRTPTQAEPRLDCY